MRYSILVIALCGALFAGCDQALAPTKASIGGAGGSGFAALAITPTTAVIPIGGTLQLVANGTAAAQGVSWRLDRTDIATVSANGLVTGVAPGQVVVTATSSADTSLSSRATILVQ